VGGVLIDENQAVAGFQQDVGVGKLPQDGQGRKDRGPGSRLRPFELFFPPGGCGRFEGRCGSCGPDGENRRRRFSGETRQGPMELGLGFHGILPFPAPKGLGGDRPRGRPANRSRRGPVHQGFPDDVSHRFQDLRRVSKSDLSLGGMNVHVHQGGGQIHEEHRNGKSSCGQQGVVGTQNGAAQHPFPNRSSVDEQEQGMGVGALELRQPGQTPYR